MRDALQEKVTQVEKMNFEFSTKLGSGTHINMFQENTRHIAR